MRQKLAKYFWGLNEKVLKETAQILKNPEHPRFKEKLVAVLSRCDKPKELFTLISRKEFINVWPRVREYWRKMVKTSDFRDWWDSIYEQILQEYNIKKPKVEDKSFALSIKIGRIIRETRINKGLSQNELALRTGMKQPDISIIEEGKKNITLKTLSSLCKVLEIKNIEL